MKQQNLIDLMIFNQLSQFRQQLYEQFGTAKDALFELMDAVLVSESIGSLVRLSQSPVFRRRWSSIYSALQDGRLPQGALLKTVTEQVAVHEQPILAGDRTLWPRPDAVTLKERTFEYQSGRPPVAGHSYSTLAWIPEVSGSWALPLRHERISSFETPAQRAAFQLRQVTRQLGRRPLAVYDRGYGHAQFFKQTATIAADLLVRVASNRCVYGSPPPYSGRGAPRKHGVKFKLNAPATWPEADTTIEVEDSSYGRVQLTHWSHYHFQQSPQRPMEMIRVEVVAPMGRKRKFQVLWLVYAGQKMPDLATIWRIYLRRFALEHWYRLAKQRLHWTQPQLHSVQATECWSLLILLVTWQLWLARRECIDTPLPWQAAQDNLAPGRVAQAFANVSSTKIRVQKKRLRVTLKVLNSKPLSHVFESSASRPHPDLLRR